MLSETIYGGDSVYYDMLFVGYTDGSGEVQRRAMASNSESSESTPLEIYGESGQFIWSGDSLEWTWVYGYSGFATYTVRGTAELVYEVAPSP